MTKTPRVAIVTPTKNRLALLCEAMDSVQAQTFADWEHLIVDDGSNDGTAEEVERRSKQDSRIRFIRRTGDKTGANICRNIGIRHSRADYVLFLDSDDLLEPHSLARRVAKLARNADLDFVTFQTSFFIDEIGDHDQYRDRDLLGDDLTRFLFFELPWIVTGPLWRKSSLERIGLFDESLPSWQDVELHIRALTMGVRYLRFSEVDHHVRWDNSVRRTSADQRKSPKHLDAALDTLEKFERMIRAGPGMTWIRQRALCSLYFFVAERWVEAREPVKALETWRDIHNRGLGTTFLHRSGALLLLFKSYGLPSDRLINKWKGLMRLRTNAELVTPRSVGVRRPPKGRCLAGARTAQPSGSAAARNDSQQ